MVVATLSGVPRVGGRVTWGRTGYIGRGAKSVPSAWLYFDGRVHFWELAWILAVTKTPLTSEVMMELLPTPSSPHTQIRTVAIAGVHDHCIAT